MSRSAEQKVKDRESARLRWASLPVEERQRRSRRCYQQWASKPANVAKKKAQKHAPRKRKQERDAGRPRPELCEVCDRPAGHYIMAFDHCHVCEKFRGWLCHHCNRSLGMCQDSPEILRKLADYLEKHRCAS